MNARPLLITVLFAIVIFVWLLNNARDPDVNVLNAYDRNRAKALESPKNVVNMLELMFAKDEFLDRTNTSDRLYEYLRAFSLYSPFATRATYHDETARKIANQPAANESLCGNQLNWLIQEIHKANINSPDGILSIKGKLGFQLVTFLESYGTVKSSVHEGTETTWPGSYAICIKANVDKAKIKPRYCTGYFRLKHWPKTDIVYPAPRISIGLCLPKSCESNSIFNETHREAIEWLAKQSLTKYYKENLILDDLYCIPDEESPLRQISLVGKILLYSLTIWVISVLIATCFYHNKSKQESRSEKPELIYSQITEISDKQKQQVTSENEQDECLWKAIVNSLSLRQTMRTFRTNRYAEMLHEKYHYYNLTTDKHMISAETNNSNKHELTNLNDMVEIIDEESHFNRVDLRCLNFIKSIMALMVVFGHGVVFSGIYATTIYAKRDLSIADSPHILLSIGRCIDTFFLIFGLLTSYTLLRKVPPKQLGNPLLWISTNIHIFLRVAPIYMISYLFNKHVAVNLGSGPNWDYGVELVSPYSMCRNEPWWRVIPYLSRTGPISQACNPPGWFIVDYIQLALLLPTLIYLIYTIPKYYQKFLLIAYLMAVSCTHLYMRLSSQQVVPPEAFTIFGGMIVLIVEKYHATGYMDTLTRLSSVSFGCLVGYLLHQYQIGVISKWPSWLTKRSTIWLTIGAHIFISLLPVIGHRLYLRDNQVASLEQFLAGNIVFYVVWMFMNSILLINGTTVYKRALLLRFMGHHFWYCFNKLGLCIFLLHYQIELSGITILDTGLYNGSVVEGLILGGYGVTLTIIVSAFVHIFIEAPFSQLISTLQIRFGKQFSQSIQNFETKQQTEQLNGHLKDQINVNGQRTNSTILTSIVSAKN